MARTFVCHSIEELRGGLRSVQSGDIESPDYFTEPLVPAVVGASSFDHCAPPLGLAPRLCDRWGLSVKPPRPHFVSFLLH